jgi:hypothetical protein
LVTKILGAIHDKLKSVIEKDGINVEENNKRNDSNETKDVEIDQQELF